MYSNKYDGHQNVISGIYEKIFRSFIKICYSGIDYQREYLKGNDLNEKFWQMYPFWLAGSYLVGWTRMGTICYPLLNQRFSTYGASLIQILLKIKFRTTLQKSKFDLFVLAVIYELYCSTIIFWSLFILLNFLLKFSRI